MEKSIQTAAFFSQESPFKEALKHLRSLLLHTELKEDYKWDKPVYTLEGKNVVGLGVFKNHFALLFFNGATLRDENNLLVNAQEGKTKQMRQLRFTSEEQIDENVIKLYVKEAIAHQKLNPESQNIVRPAKLTLPNELQNAFSLSKHLKERFELLPAEKQQEYIKYITEGEDKQERSKRLEHSIPFIMRLRGLDKELL